MSLLLLLRSSAATPPVTWDTSSAGTDWALTNSNKTATRSTNSAFSLLRATLSKTSSYFEVLVGAGDSTGAFNGTIGLANSSAVTSNWPGQDANSIGYHGDGRVFYGNSQVDTGAAYTAADRVSVYVSPNGKAYFAKNGVWQGLTGGVARDPATDNGIDVTALGGMFPVVSSFASGCIYTGAWVVSDQSYSIPTGGSAWDLTAATRKAYGYAFIMG